MEKSAHTYTAPRTSIVMPKAVLDYLNGEKLLSKTQALRIATVSTDGSPHASLLSAGDAVALPNNRLRFAVFQVSATAANLVRSSHFTFTMIFDNAVFELRFNVKKLKDEVVEVPLSFFEGELTLVREHRVAYADLTSGICFFLHDPKPILVRWNKQIEALRAA